MAKKKSEPVVEEQDIIITPIPGYEDTYGITDDGIAHSLAISYTIPSSVIP